MSARTTTVEAYFIRHTDMQVIVSLISDVMNDDYQEFALPLSECTFDNNIERMDFHGYEPLNVTLPLWLQDKLEFYP